MKLKTNILRAYIVLLAATAADGAMAQVPDSIATNIACDFWAGFVLNGSALETYEGKLTFTATETCTVSVSCPFATVTTHTLPLAAGESGSVMLAQRSDGVSADHIELKGYHITSTGPVQAVASWSKLASSGATALLPTQALGTRYRIVDYPTDPGRVDNGSAAEVLVIATEPMTHISFTPPCDLTTPALPAGQAHGATIGQAHGYYTIASTVAGASISGMEITADKPIAVFQGNRLCGVPHNTPSGDYMYEQALPVSQWGQEYAVVPTGTRTVGDRVRIVADLDCTVSVSSTGQTFSLVAGGVNEIDIATGQPCIISATAPVAVALCQKGSDWNAEPGDASMLVVPPLDRAVSRAVFTPIATERITQRWYLTLVTDNPGAMTLDGASIAQRFQPIGTTGYHWAQMAVSQLSHTVESNGGTFVGWAGGFGNVDSYLHSLGHRYDTLRVRQHETHHDTVVLADTVCQGEEYVTTHAPYAGLFRLTAAETHRAGALERWGERVEDDTLVHHVNLQLRVLPTTTRDTTAVLTAGDTLFFADTVLTLAGTYRFHFAAANGCDSVVVLNVRYEQAGIHASADGICPGDSVVLTATGETSALWEASPPDTSLAGQMGMNPVTVRPARTTTYTLTDATGIAIGSHTVTVDASPTLCIEGIPRYVDFDHPVVALHDCSEGRYSTAWDFDDGVHRTGERVRRMLHNPMPDSIRVTMTSCSRFACCADTTIMIPTCTLSLWFPNVFTPDEDINNRFGCSTTYEVAEFQLHVYNRWGLHVWGTTDVNASWDGTHDGTPVQQGSYPYIWWLKEADGLVHSGTGTVTLLR